MMMVTRPDRINQRSLIMLLLSWRTACHLWIGVNAASITFTPVVMTDAIIILTIKFRYLIRLVNSRKISLATVIVLALAW